MAIQIANPNVVKKIEWLAASLNTSKTGAVERALDAFKLQNQLVAEQASKEQKAEEFMRRSLSILAQFDALPVTNPHAGNDLEWDEHGLPI